MTKPDLDRLERLETVQFPGLPSTQTLIVKTDLRWLVNVARAAQEEHGFSHEESADNYEGLYATPERPTVAVCKCENVIGTGCKVGAALADSPGEKP